jgi:hypothetical protein
MCPQFRVAPRPRGLSLFFWGETSGCVSLATERCSSGAVRKNPMPPPPFLSNDELDPTAIATHRRLPRRLRQPSLARVHAQTPPYEFAASGSEGLRIHPSIRPDISEAVDQFLVCRRPYECSEDSRLCLAGGTQATRSRPRRLAWYKAASALLMSIEALSPGCHGAPTREQVTPFGTSVPRRSRISSASVGEQPGRTTVARFAVYLLREGPTP